MPMIIKGIFISTDDMFKFIEELGHEYSVVEHKVTGDGGTFLSPQGDNITGILSR